MIGHTCSALKAKVEFVSSESHALRVWEESFPPEKGERGGGGGGGGGRGGEEDTLLVHLIKMWTVRNKQAFSSTGSRKSTSEHSHFISHLGFSLWANLLPLVFFSCSLTSLGPCPHNA